MKKRVLCYAAVLLTATTTAAPPATQTTVTVDKVKIVNSITPRRYAGFVEAVEKVDVMPRVTGELRKINFVEGEIVKKGDLLFEIEDTTYRAAVDALEARKEQLAAQAEFMQKEFKRYQELISNKAVAASTYDRSLFDLNSARAQLKEIEASLTDARNNLSYTKIHSPITGRIGKSTFSAGNLISPAAGQKLASIEMVTPIYIRFTISETILRKEFGSREDILKNGSIRIKLADDSFHPETAKITLADNRINASTNTITLWASFANQDGKLIPGGFATVYLNNSKKIKQTAILPSAIIVTPQGQSVWVIDSSNRASLRKVTTGALSGNFQIISSGLKEGETVVIEGSHKLREGMTVTPVVAK